ncbi:MAG: type I-B CRISPR-associated protein Cas5b [Bacteroides sp.]|nr:type I-B CRISPR-associated protein Cas5b [Bacteroides sp.]MCM1084848.1 type I-B CRISPR-associated protein Cas5b [Bacteroides sp.]
MKVYRIDISSWTAGFRYPNVISGYQPSLVVPPISTVLGLLNACAGKYLMHERLSLGYYFSFAAKATDLETIYQVEANKGVAKNQMKSNVINREFLYDCHLVLYLKDQELANLLKKPVYQILLGRSGDLATVESICEKDLPEIQNAEKIKGQIVPFQGNCLPGILQALPKYYTDTIPRKNLGTEAYSVIACNVSDFSTHLTAYRDTVDGKEIDIYFHDILIENDK